MAPYKREFIDFMVESEVLTFGDFVTKSGRKTPYFVNTGKYRTGAQLARLSGYYAQTIAERFGEDFDVLFGPAYKGIPLAVGIAMELARRGPRDVPFCFDRKQVKDHGEGGQLVGHQLTDGERVLIVEDVTTAGTSIRETVPKLRAVADIRLAGLIVSVDRMERGSGADVALVEISRTWSMSTCAIVTIEEIMQDLHGREVGGTVLLGDEIYERMLAYRKEYGPRA
ncbi:MAG: orotate phosphoribosyltransferase [Candidatus Binatia bacterium]|nr:orotate phosphoribosyltransferase [Candidatus Binatia bacterium]